jgi:2'-hydroxyisoflavone reductase
VIKLADPTVEEVTSKTYGGLKALCEEVVHKFFPGRALIARPGVIAGPYDNTDRFTYWVKRIAAGGEVLVPDAWEQPVQLIDHIDNLGALIQALGDTVDISVELYGEPTPALIAVLGGEGVPTYRFVGGL